jgi:hypothetical protein
MKCKHADEYRATNKSIHFKALNGVYNESNAHNMVAVCKDCSSWLSENFPQSNPKAEV